MDILAKNKLSTVGWIIFVCTIFAICIVILWQIGLIPVKDTDKEAKVVAAALGLVGAFITAMVTLVGILLKRSFDLRSLQLKAEAEDRLKMETAIRAVRLLSTETGVEAPKNQQAGALFALASLGQIDFALALLEQIWPTEKINRASAVWLINKAFLSKSKDNHNQAADIICENAEKLVCTDGSNFILPKSFDLVWNMNVTVYARQEMLEVLLKCMLKLPVKKWDPPVINGFACMFYLIMKNEDQKFLRAEAVAILEKLLPIISKAYRGFYLPDFIPINQIKKEVVSLKKELAPGKGGEGDIRLIISKLIQNLDQWANEDNTADGLTSR
jgi:hypothetical protein